MSRPRRVSVAIVSWNGRQHLETCLAALGEQIDPGVDWEVLVLDNGSSDGTAAWLRQARQPRVRLIESAFNVGFCAGNNRLVAEAAGDAIAFLNNDTRPRPDWLAALVEALGGAASDVAAVSGKIVDWPGERLDFARGVMAFDGHAFQVDFRRPLGSARLPAAGEELLFGCGGNMLIRRDAFLAAGGFDESYFAYLEDVDLGWRLWAGGQRVVFAPEAVVHHRSNATSDLLGLYNRGFLFERNAFLTAYKNYEPGTWERIMPALLLTFLSRTQAMMVTSNPGGTTLLLDPYAGWIANTSGPANRRERSAAGEERSAAGEESRAAAGNRSAAAGDRSAGAGAEIARGGGSAAATSLLDPRAISRKWREHGTRELFRRAAAKLRARIERGRAPQAAGVPMLTDERTIAQLRALTYLLAHLDPAAARRAAVQGRRQRSDREIFARFPLYLVPTYPGDERLFSNPGFAAWLPADLPLVRATLEEVMEMGEQA